jgi:hypothetical protein
MAVRCKLTIKLNLKSPLSLWERVRVRAIGSQVMNVVTQISICGNSSGSKLPG